MTDTKKFNAFQIKLFMAMLMVLDHLPHIPGLVPPLWEGVFHALTRCVAVWFAYMAVEGFLHTHDRARYNARLFIWAFAMFAGNALLNRLFAPRGVEIHNNIFFTLAVGELLLNALCTPVPGSELWSAGKRRALTAGRAVCAAAACAAGFWFGEGFPVVVPFMLITYFCRDRIKLRNLLYAAMSALLLALSYVRYPTAAETVDMLLFNSDWLFITVLPFMYLYNGRRGPNGKFNKYFFYVFYPAHLWLIAAIAYFTA
jgi:hypothetical protein